jgi:plasmid stabilization system protein ParE
VRVRFAEAAHGDLVEAREFYGGRRREARIGFNREVRGAVALLSDHPEAGKPAGKTAREYVIDVYPFSLIYYVSEAENVVAAVAHHSRDPTFWHDRFGGAH